LGQGLLHFHKLPKLGARLEHGQRAQHAAQLFFFVFFFVSRHRCYDYSLHAAFNEVQRKVVLR
jgi:hypothetical protein